MSQHYHLFVYGSLRRGFKHPAYEYISHYFELVGDARAIGDLFDMGEYPVAVPGKGEHFIIGELYRIKDEREFSWAIGQLDDYEGVTVEAGEYPEFRRDLIEVECQGETQQAWIYWYNSSTDGRPLVESGDVLKYMQEKKQL